MNISAKGAYGPLQPLHQPPQLERTRQLKLEQIQQTQMRQLPPEVRELMRQHTSARSLGPDLLSAEQMFARIDDTPPKEMKSRHSTLKKVGLGILAVTSIAAEGMNGI